MIRKFTTTLLTIVFLGAMFGSLFHLTMSMDMTGEMSGCPFTAQGETICSMSTLDHIGTWQSAFLTTVPGLTLLLSVLAAAVVILSVAPNVLLKPKYRITAIPKEIVERIYTFSYRPLQELFSSGILHPKLF